jgi:tetratricopeptide (TPR) repeat protein
LDVNVPSTPDPRLDCAFDLHEAGDLDGAIEACRTILQLDDRRYGALYLLGSVLGQKKRFVEAAEALRRAIAVDASRPLAHLNLANILRWMGRFAESLAAIDAYLSLKAENAEALALRADVLTELGRLDDAVLSAAPLLRRRPTLRRTTSAATRWPSCGVSPRRKPAMTGRLRSLLATRKRSTTAELCSSSRDLSIRRLKTARERSR